MLRRFFQNHLRSATPPTPEQPDFIWETNPEFRPVARQNPPVLQPLETVYSRSKHPLSSVSGRRRYNTLDFPQENRVPTGCFHPYWKPRSKGTCSPFTIPARLRICGHKLKNSLQTQIHKRKKSHSRSSKKKRKACGIFIMPHSLKRENSCVMHRCCGAFFETLTRVPAKEH